MNSPYLPELLKALEVMATLEGGDHSGGCWFVGVAKYPRRFAGHGASTVCTREDHFSSLYGALNYIGRNLDFMYLDERLHDEALLLSMERGWYHSIPERQKGLAGGVR